MGVREIQSCPSKNAFSKQGGGLGFHGNLRIYADGSLATVLLANRMELSPGPIDTRSDELDRAVLSARR